MPSVRARATVFVAYANIIVGLGALGPLQTAYRGESQTWWIWIFESFEKKYVKPLGHPGVHAKWSHWPIFPDFNGHYPSVQVA